MNQNKNVWRLTSTELVELDEYRELNGWTWSEIDWKGFGYPLERGSGEPNSKTEIKVVSSHPCQVSMQVAQREPNEKKNTCEVHLICSDGYIPVHRIFLENTLKLYPVPNSAIADELKPSESNNNIVAISLMDVKLEHLKVVVSLMYRGEAIIEEKDQKEVKAVIDMLQITGLWDDLEVEQVDPDNPLVKKRKKKMVRCFYYDDESEIRDKSSAHPPTPVSAEGALTYADVLASTRRREEAKTPSKSNRHPREELEEQEAVVVAAGSSRGNRNDSGQATEDGPRRPVSDMPPEFVKVHPRTVIPRQPRITRKASGGIPKPDNGPNGQSPQPPTLPAEIATCTATREQTVSATPGPSPMSSRMEENGSPGNVGGGGQGQTRPASPKLALPREFRKLPPGVLTGKTARIKRNSKPFDPNPESWRRSSRIKTRTSVAKNTQSSSNPSRASTPDAEDDDEDLPSRKSPAGLEVDTNLPSPASDNSVVSFVPEDTKEKEPEPEIINLSSDSEEAEEEDVSSPAKKRTSSPTSTPPSETGERGSDVDYTPPRSIKLPTSNSVTRSSPREANGSVDDEEDDRKPGPSELLPQPDKLNKRKRKERSKEISPPPETPPSPPSPPPKKNRGQNPTTQSPPPNSETEDIPPSADQEFSCIFCADVYSSEAELEMHLQSSCGKELSFDLCNKICKSCCSFLGGQDAKGFMNHVATCAATQGQGQPLMPPPRKKTKAKPKGKRKRPRSPTDSPPAVTSTTAKRKRKARRPALLLPTKLPSTSSTKKSAPPTSVLLSPVVASTSAAARARLAASRSTTTPEPTTSTTEPPPKSQEPTATTPEPKMTTEPVPTPAVSSPSRKSYPPHESRSPMVGSTSAEARLTASRSAEPVPTADSLPPTVASPSTNSNPPTALLPHAHDAVSTSPATRAPIDSARVGLNDRISNSESEKGVNVAKTLENTNADLPVVHPAVNSLDNGQQVIMTQIIKTEKCEDLEEKKPHFEPKFIVGKRRGPASKTCTKNGTPLLPLPPVEKRNTQESGAGMSKFDKYKEPTGGSEDVEVGQREIEMGRLPDSAREQVSPVEPSTSKRTPDPHSTQSNPPSTPSAPCVTTAAKLQQTSKLAQDNVI